MAETTTILRTYYPTDRTQSIGYINNKNYYVSYKIDSAVTSANNIKFNSFVLRKNTSSYSTPILESAGNKLYWGISQHIADSNFNISSHILQVGGTIEIDTDTKNITSTAGSAMVYLPKSSSPYYLVFYPGDTTAGCWKIPGGNNGSAVDNQMKITYSTYQGAETYIYKNNAWKLATPYIYKNGAWKQAVPSVYTNNSWH